jgi:splicing factor U2AF subunit
MALDGIMFEGVSVRVRRPNDYNPAAASTLGPSIPSPSLNLAAIGLQQGGMSAVLPGTLPCAWHHACAPASGTNMYATLPQQTALVDAAERVFVGGLPYYLNEEQCRELLGSFGAIKSFDLVKDRDTGNSKGCVLSPCMRNVALVSSDRDPTPAAPCRYGFVVYTDPSVTDIACAGLNGMRMGERTLTVRRATEVRAAQ